MRTCYSTPGAWRITHWVGAHYLDEVSGELIDATEYEIHLEAGPVLSDTLHAQGQAKHQNVANKPVEKVKPL